jgi:hypothetical protein
MNIDFKLIETYADIMLSRMDRIHDFADDKDICEDQKFKIYKLHWELTDFQFDLAYAKATIDFLAWKLRKNKKQANLLKAVQQLAVECKNDDLINIRACKIILRKYHPELLSKFEELLLLL